MVVRGKPGHHAAIVSIQLELCKIRTLISCSHNSTVIGYQRIKVTAKAGRPCGTPQQERWGPVTSHSVSSQLVVSVLVLPLGITMFGRSSMSRVFRKEREGKL